jgi:hypothetical protein
MRNSEVSILSRPEHSEGRIEGCGGPDESWPTRTPFDRPFDKLRKFSGRGFDTRFTLFRATQDASLVVILQLRIIGS